MITIKKITIHDPPEVPLTHDKYRFYESIHPPSERVQIELKEHLKESTVTPLVFDDDKVYRARQNNHGLFIRVETADAEEFYAYKKYQEFLPVVESLEVGWKGRIESLMITSNSRDQSKPYYHLEDGELKIYALKTKGGVRCVGLHPIATIKVDEEKCEKCGQKLL